jgi:hypothetical protein
MSFTESTGLLMKATRLRASASPRPEVPVEDDRISGIDAKDRAEIAARLDELTRGSRISSDPSVFAIKAKKNGAILPILVNLLTILAVGGAIFVLVRLSARQESETAQNGVALQSSEGRLIAELKKESASQLDAKDREIADIQARMAALDKQKGDLVQTMDARIKAKESELRAALAIELEQERQRLLAQGLSEAAVQEKLKLFEAQKNAEFARQLAAFQQQVAAERSQQEAKLAAVRSEYESSIANLAEERKKIQAEAQKREDDLRASLDAKARSLAAENARSLAGLEAAKAELARLDSQKKASQSADERIVALYASVRQALDDKRYSDAAVQAAALRAYLDDPAVLSLQSMATRREADIFASEALASLSRIQLDRASQDTTKLVKQAELLQSVQAAIADAKRLAAAGDRAGADARYGEALALVPDIMSAHDYFMKKAQDEEAARQAKLRQAIDQANAAYKARDYAAMTARYEESLAYLPISAEERRDIIVRSQEAGGDATAKTRAAADARTARARFDLAQKDLKAAKWDEAFASFLSILESFPSSEQAQPAARGLREAFAGMARAGEERAAADAAQAKDLRDRIGDLTRQASADAVAKEEAVKLARTEDAAELEKLRAEKDAAIADLQARLEAAQRQSLGLGGTGGTQAVPADTAAALAYLRAENDRLREAADRYNAMLSSYTRYYPAPGNGSAFDPTSAYGNLMGFLGDQPALSAFPSLGPTAKRLFAELRTSVAETSVKDEADICLRLVDILQRYPAPADRNRELRALESEYSRQPAMLNLIKELEKRIASKG